MTIELAAVKKLMPKGHRTLITQEYLDRLEASVGDSLVAEQFKDNFLTYINVMSTGKYKMDDYVNAVKYVSHKLLGKSNIDAYAATFPDRFQRLKDEGQTQIDAFCSMYNKNKLVMQIYEQTIVPSHVLNAPLYQEALNELALMIKDPSVRGMVKVKACEAVLAHTKAPEIIENKFSISLEQNDTIASLREVTEQLADTYKLALEKGHRNLKQLAEESIIDVEYTEDD